MFVVSIEWNLSETEPGINGKQSLAEKCYNPEGPKCKYLYETEPACNGKKFQSLVFRLLVGSVFFSDSPEASLFPGSRTKVKCQVPLFSYAHNGPFVTGHVHTTSNCRNIYAYVDDVIPFKSIFVYHHKSRTKKPRVLRSSWKQLTLLT